MVKSGDLSPNQIPKEQGKEPLCEWDVQCIASVYPKGCSDRVQVMSWVTVGLHTGVRGISLATTFWEDIKVVEPVPEAPHFKQITLVFRETKGDHNWNHPITIEGSALNACGSDPVCWLSQLVKEQLSFEVELTQATVSKLKGRIFGCESQSTMSERMNSVAVYCGYPSRLFSCHSLRSGFLCTALLKHAVETGKEVNFPEVWNKCALVAGWHVQSKHMERYCKQAFLRCIVSSRLIQAGSLQAGTEEIVAKIIGIGSVAKNRLTPQHFHGLGDEPLTAEWPESTKTQLWVDKLGALVETVLKQNRKDLGNAALVAAKQSIINNIYVRLARLNDLIEKDDLSYRDTRLESKRVVKEWVQDRFEANNDTKWLHFYLLQSVKEVAVEIALDYEFDEERSARKKKSMAKKRHRSPERNEGSAGGRRKLNQQKKKKTRVAWTHEETAVLCQGVIKFGARWSQIATAATLLDRTGPNCKDRMRTLVKQYAGGGKCVDVAQCWLKDNGIESVQWK